MTRLALEVDPEIADRPLRQKALRKRLEKRGYSKGEILYAIDQLADDPDLDEKIRYGGDLSAADFRRVIEPIREVRKRLGRGEILTEQEVYDAVQTVPGLEVEDFDACRAPEQDRRFVLIAEARERLGLNE